MDRKKTFATEALTIFLIVLAAVFAWSCLNEVWALPNGYATVKADGTAFRKSSSTKSKLISRKNQGTKVTITREKYTKASSTKLNTRWVKTTGSSWVRRDTVKVSYGKKTGYASADQLNYRTGPAQSYKSLGKLRKGAAITLRIQVTASDGTAWYRASIGGKTVFVMKKYVTLKKPAAPAPAPADDQTPQDSFAPKASVTVKANGTGVRKSYTTDSNLVTRLNAGKKVSAYTEKFLSNSSTKSTTRWMQVSNGWVRRDLVSVSYGSRAAYVNGDAVRMRKGPSTSFDSLGQLAKGTKVTVRMRTLNKSGEVWYRVTAAGKNCYIRADLVSSSDTNSNNGSSSNTSSSYIGSGIPASYIPYLKNIHQKHPSWRFEAEPTGLDWKAALAKMTAKSGVNTIDRTQYGQAYFSVESDVFNYLTGDYKGLDGANFVGASQNAVAYFMDPRNWLSSKYIFQFQSNRYHDYQDLDMVKTALDGNTVLKKNAKYFVSAGKTYNVSPVFLAVKARNELGTSTKMISGKYPGYEGYYNAFNIGANDSASGGAVNAMKYAKSQGWTSLSKAITQGTKILNMDYIKNNQDSPYLEHFNVMNGLHHVGSHVYMTAVYTPSLNASSVYNSFKANGMLSKKLTFYIPVYNNMPASPAKKPGSGNNNYYLKTLKLTAGGKTKTLISRSDLDYTRVMDAWTAPNGAASVKISAAAAGSGAKVSGTGTRSLKVGTNKMTVKVTASSGLTRTYTVTVIRKK